jgi:hypothetical protein
MPQNNPNAPQQGQPQQGQPAPQEHQAMAAAMGIDWNAVDWTKVLTAIRFFLDLLQRTPMGAAASGGPAQGDGESCCHQAACHSLEAAKICLEHVAHCESNRPAQSRR